MTKPVRLSAADLQTTQTLPDARWAAVCARRAPSEGDFVYAVKTTGVYCRPGCASRRPNRQNVDFYDTSALAEAAGFRPCLRCRPNQNVQGPAARVVIEACRLIEAAQTPPRLEDLAAAAGLSPFHFQRKFKEALGVTPAAYARAVRAGRVREALSGPGDVTQAIYDAGFNSSGRFYEQSGDTLGMTPTAFKKRGQGELIRFASSPCWLGQVMVAATDRGVCAITFGDDPAVLLEDLRARFRQARLIAAGPEFQATLDQVLDLVEEPAKANALPLDIRGAAFQQRVWQALTKIPAGSTASYSEIARAIGAPAAARAVARACAGNPLALAIPCHRVVRADGALSGYRWGVERKRAILARESEG